MALDDILTAIRADSRETSSAVLAAAQAGADQILERAHEEAAREEQRQAASLDDKARIERSRIMSRAHLEAARERRKAREQVYLTALDGVAHRIEAVRHSSEYEEMLASLLDEAVAVLPEATTVHVDPEDVDSMVRLLTARNLDIIIEPEECALGGVVVVAAGRSVDNRLQSRLDRADEHLRHVAGELIPGLRGSPG